MEITETQLTQHFITSMCLKLQLLEVLFLEKDILFKLYKRVLYQVIFTKFKNDWKLSLITGKLPISMSVLFSLKYSYTGCVICLGTEFQMSVAHKWLWPGQQKLSVFHYSLWQLFWKFGSFTIKEISFMVLNITKN